MSSVSQTNRKYHVPVMLEECLEALQVTPGGTYVDVTLVVEVILAPFSIDWMG